jgi:hypothetical protein
MRTGVIVGFAAVVAARDDFATGDNDCTDWYLTLLRSDLRLGERRAHVAQVPVRPGRHLLQLSSNVDIFFINIHHLLLIQSKYLSSVQLSHHSARFCCVCVPIANQ